jgi:hypothetical protein
MNGVLTTSTATMTAMSGFAVALLVGLWGENSTALVLERSLLAMAACFAAGWLVGCLLERVVRQEGHAVALSLQTEFEKSFDRDEVELNLQNDPPSLNNDNSN